MNKLRKMKGGAQNYTTNDEYKLLNINSNLKKKINLEMKSVAPTI